MAAGDRTRYRFDRDMNCLVEIRDGANWESHNIVAPTNLIRDIDNYNAIGIRDPSKPPGHTLVITKGRRQHRDELRARGMIEVGNDTSAYAERPKMADARPMVREALSAVGYDNGARTIRELRRQGR